MMKKNAVLALCLSMLGASSLLEAANAYLVRNLVSDIPDLADHTDPNLIAAWGISESATSPFWISDAGTGVATLYDSSGNPIPLVVTIAVSKAGGSTGSPTGTVWNGTTGFDVASGQPAVFLFDTLDGTISGWNPKVNKASTIVMVDNSSKGASYFGLAMGASGGNSYLFAANFAAGTIDVFDSNFAPVTLMNGFKDPKIPAGYAPFNVQNLGGKLYVAYAQQNAGKNFASTGAGLGYVDVYDTAGNLLQHLIAGGQLNAPWGLAIAPAGFGDFAGDLLVGNFGDGTINVFNPSTGTSVATLTDTIGARIVVPGLWALQPGNGASGGDANAIYFTAGIPGPDSGNHGLFGRLQAAPAIAASGGVFNAASATSGIAPNTWISIKGANLAETTRIWNGGDFVSNALPIELDGVRVTINGSPAYVYYVSPTQINVLTPTDVATGTATVITNNNGLVSASASIQVQSLGPAFFPSSDGKHVAATHADGSIVGPAGTAGETPAKPGETIVLYGTGFGATNPAIPNGMLVTAALALVTPPTITIGGTGVQPAFAGLTGPGLYQFNVTVPATAPDGDVPVSAQLGALTTQANMVIPVQH